ncbi:MAG: hypothetical protein R6V49_04810 [Bacteroidales bacterium]
MLLILVPLTLNTGCRKEDYSTPRGKAIKDYNDHYLGSYVPDPLWTGYVSNCVEGTISDDARSKVLMRLNYFRRLVGLSDNITENYLQRQDCQKASLIFKAEGNLSHFPTSSWACYTPEGAAAAATSNIAWGTAVNGEWSVHTTYGVTGFIEEPGDNNTKVGHRAWFFLPGLHSIGIGSTNTTCCMQWKDNYDVTGPAPEFIAYPPNGYMPNKLVFPRWSFCIPGGDAGFEDAAVSMTDDKGKNVPLTLVNRPAATPGKALLPQLVWEPSLDVSAIKSDKRYTVTVTNVSGTAEGSYVYEVIVVPVDAVKERRDPSVTDDRRILGLLRPDRKRVENPSIHIAGCKPF